MRTFVEAMLKVCFSGYLSVMHYTSLYGGQSELWYSHMPPIRSISEISSCFVGPRPWHIEIRHRVKRTSAINLFGFETLKLTIWRLKLWKPTVFRELDCCTRRWRTRSADHPVHCHRGSFRAQGVQTVSGTFRLFWSSGWDPAIIWWRLRPSC